MVVGDDTADRENRMSGKHCAEAFKTVSSKQGNCSFDLLPTTVLTPFFGTSLAGVIRRVIPGTMAQINPTLPYFWKQNGLFAVYIPSPKYAAEALLTLTPLATRSGCDNSPLYRMLSICVMLV